MFWLRLVWIEPHDIAVFFVVKKGQILAESSSST